jgi:hypothetical protein
VYFKARSQKVVVVGSPAEELDQGPERRLDGTEPESPLTRNSGFIRKNVKVR